VLKAGPPLIAALKGVYQATASKLDDVTTPGSDAAVNDRVVSTTDPDAAVVRKGPQPPRARYQHHRVIDDAEGVITAVETTPGSIAENKRLLPLIDRHHTNTGQTVQTAVADRKYGTTENYLACQHRAIRTHLGEARRPIPNVRCHGIFPDSAFTYDAATNTYRCPAGQTLKPRRLHPTKHTWEYYSPKGVCAACPLRPQCTRASYGRTIHRHEQQAILDQARAQAHSATARRDRRRRQHLCEQSFADAANHHGFKQARWRRLWRVQIQDWLIAGIQNIKILLKHRRRPAASAGAALLGATTRVSAGCAAVWRLLRRLSAPGHPLTTS